MAQILHPPLSSSSFTTTIKPHRLLQFKPTKFYIKSQQDSSTEQSTSGPGPSVKKPDGSSPGLGFGSSAAAPAKKQQKPPKGNRERTSVIRRDPFGKPSLTPQQAAQAEEMKKNESAFLLAWFGLGAVILLEGIALSASGFLPEAWDKFLVKYLYPIFTPTVFLFIAGTVTYGVLKYLQTEKSNPEN